MAGRKGYTWAPAKASKAKPSESVKRTLKAKADEIIESVMKPEYVEEPPEDSELNYIIDIYTKWWRNYFYFCSKYCCPGPHAISPSFENKFARMEYLQNGRFNLAYMRHTGQWFELESNIPMEEALREIREGGHYMP